MLSSKGFFLHDRQRQEFMSFLKGMSLCLLFMGIFAILLLSNLIPSHFYRDVVARAFFSTACLSFCVWAMRKNDREKLSRKARIIAIASFALIMVTFAGSTYFTWKAREECREFYHKQNLNSLNCE